MNKWRFLVTNLIALYLIVKKYFFWFSGQFLLNIFFLFLNQGLLVFKKTITMLNEKLLLSTQKTPGRVAQSVTCLATDVCLTADPGVASSIPVRSHTFVEIDHEMISTVILLPSADSFKKGCCQLQAKVCARITG